MAKLKLPFELERISTSSPAVSTDAIDDRNFQKSQEKVNQIFKNSISSAETKFSEDIEALSTKLQELSDKIDRNWVGDEYVEEEGQINAILSDDSKIKEVTVDEDGNIVFTQLIN